MKSTSAISVFGTFILNAGVPNDPVLLLALFSFHTNDLLKAATNSIYRNITFKSFLKLQKMTNIKLYSDVLLLYFIQLLNLSHGHYTQDRKYNQLISRNIYAKYSKLLSDHIPKEPVLFMGLLCNCFNNGTCPS